MLRYLWETFFLMAPILQGLKDYVRAWFVAPNKIADTFCVFPWRQISTTPMGEISVCCESHLVSRDGKPKAFFNSYALRQLRRDLATGVKSDHCVTCWRREEGGGLSPRLLAQPLAFQDGGKSVALKMIRESALHDYHWDRLKQLDLKFGNTCNLQCRMCTPNNSSKLWSEFKNHRDELMPFHDHYQFADRYYEGQIVPAQIDEWIEMSEHIERLNISGGEPMLVKDTAIYLRALVERGYAPNITVTFNTNATLINWEIIELLRSFKEVQFYLSIDGIEALYEYIRYPAKWEEVAANAIAIARYFEKNFNSESFVCLSPTYQALNILNLTDVFRWGDANGIRWQISGSVNDPAFQDAMILPERVRKLAAERLSEYRQERKADLSHYQDVCLISAIGHLAASQPREPELLERFHVHCRVMDKIRGQSFKDSCSELFGLLRDA